MLISNLEVIPDRKVTKHLGLVQGSSVRSKHVGRDIMASIKNIFGGELVGYTELLSESREEAMDRLKQQAEAVGAPPVSGLLSPLKSLKLSGANKVNNGLFHRTKRGNTQEIIATH